MSVNWETMQRLDAAAGRMRKAEVWGRHFSGRLLLLFSWVDSWEETGERPGAQTL